MPTEPIIEQSSRSKSTMRRSISVELALALFFVLAVVESLLLTFLYSNQSDVLLQAVDDKINNYVLNISKVLSVPLWDLDTEQISRIGQVLLQNEIVNEIKIEDREGVGLFHAQKRETLREETRRIKEITYEDKPVGRIIFTFTLDPLRERDFLFLRNTILTVFILSLVVILIATGTLLNVLMRRPLTILQESIDLIANGNYDDKIGDIRHRELAGIMTRFKEMASLVRLREESMLQLNKKLHSEIEEREAAEVALKESEQKFKAVFNQTFQLMALLTPQGEVIEVNQSTVSQTRLDIGRTIGKPIWETPLLIGQPKLERLRLRESIKLVSDGQVVRYEISNSSQEDQADVNFIDLSLSPLKDTNEKTDLIIWEARDISELKRAERKIRKFNQELEERVRERTQTLSDTLAQLREREEAQRRSEEKFRELTDLLPLSIFELDSDGNISYLNEYGYQKTEYTEKDIKQGLNLTKLIVWRDKDKAIENYKKIMSGLKSAPTEYTVLKKRGERFHGEVYNSPILNEGKVIGIRGVLIDISRRKKAEEELIKAKAAAEEANRAKSEFLANMSHELRTPLNAVIGFSELLSAYVEEKSIRGHIQAIQTAGKTLLTLINDILDFSKAEAGKIELRPIPTNLLTILNEMKLLFEAKSLEKNVAFNVKYSDNYHPIFMLDENRIRQVLINLVGNAVKFTEKGHISLSVDIHRKPDYQSLVDLTITVADTGIGIHPKERERIFESFTQQYSQSTRKYPGTGLGLAICKKLTELMNGEILLDSHVGKGSEFKVILRDVRIASAGIIEEREELFDINRITFSRAKILVVDDVEVNRNLLSDILKKINLDVISAQNGEEALLLAREFAPDLIIMDIKMPVLDGISATKQIKDAPKTRHIPVIAFTSYLEERDRSSLPDSGFSGSLLKPIDFGNLVSELSKYIDFIEKPESERSKSGEEDFSHADRRETVKKREELIERLKSDFLPKSQTLSSAGKMSVVDTFGEELERLGTAHNAPSLIRFGAELREMAKLFDLVNIGKLISRFPKLVASYEKERPTTHHS